MAVNLLELFADDLKSPHRNCDSVTPKQSWWDVIWGTGVGELGYDQPPWCQGALLLVAKATRSLSCLVSGLALSLPEKMWQVH